MQVDTVLSQYTVDEARLDNHFGTSPKHTSFHSPLPSPSGSEKSDLTLDEFSTGGNSLATSSVVSLSHLNVSETPKIPSTLAYFSNQKVIEHIQGDRNKKRVAKPKVVLDRIDGTVDDAKIFGDFSVEDIRQTFNFIKKQSGNEDRLYFDCEDFEAAFRQVKRAQKQRAMEEEARKFMRTFRFLLQLSNKTPEQWFVETDTTPDCKLTWSEFETGMQKLCTDLGGAMFSKNGLLAMLRYMDPLCIGELTAPEVKAAFKRIKLPSKSVVILTDAGLVFNQLQKFIKERAVRVQDLFNLFDISRTKHINMPSFCIGIERINGLLLSGGLTVEVLLDTSHRPEAPVKSFDPIGGVDLSSAPKGPTYPRHEHHQSNAHFSSEREHLVKKTGVKNADPKSNKAEPPPLNKLRLKPRIPPSPIRCSTVDKAALKERDRLLNGLKLPGVPPPVKVNYKHIVQKGIQRFEPWIKHFDSTMRTGLMLYEDS